MALLDAASDRITERAAARFEDMVEATRAGAIFAHDRRQYQRWRAKHHARLGQSSRGLTGDALEAAVSRIADLFPGHVVEVAA